jgi:hypothetical protein
MLFERNILSWSGSIPRSRSTCLGKALTGVQIELYGHCPYAKIFSWGGMPSWSGSIPRSRSTARKGTDWSSDRALWTLSLMLRYSHGEEHPHGVGQSKGVQ